MPRETMPGPSRKQQVLERHGHRCVYCGEQFDAADLTVDHVEPRVKGGDHSEGNLVACCRACNAAKGGLAAWAFLATRPDVRANFLRHARWVWPRLRRGVEEAAEAAVARASDGASGGASDGASGGASGGLGRGTGGGP